jgi:flagellar biosynthesis protein
MDADGKPPVDPNKLAVALKYERGVDAAPVLAAKGKGYIAEKIIELAKAHGIEVRKDEDLVAVLAKLDVDMPIPVEAYVAVAEILSYIYKANANVKHRRMGN